MLDLNFEGVNLDFWKVTGCLNCWFLSIFFRKQRDYLICKLLGDETAFNCTSLLQDGLGSIDAEKLNLQVFCLKFSLFSSSFVKFYGLFLGSCLVNQLCCFLGPRMCCSIQFEDLLLFHGYRMTMKYFNGDFFFEDVNTEE